MPDVLDDSAQEQPMKVDKENVKSENVPEKEDPEEAPEKTTTPRRNARNAKKKEDSDAWVRLDMKITHSPVGSE